MYVAFEDTQYYVRCTEVELRDNHESTFQTKEGDYLKVTKWYPTPLRAMTVEKVQVVASEVPLGVVAQHSHFEGNLTKPLTFSFLHLYFQKKSSLVVRIVLNIETDVCCHTYDAVGDYIVSRLISDADHWTKFKVTSWKVVGYIAPRSVIIEADMSMRTKFSTKRRKRKRK